VGKNFEFVILAPDVAQKAYGGNFVIVRVDEVGERTPLTVADYDRDAGTITVVVQAIGVSTSKMARLNEGDELIDFVGPLGKNAHIIKYDHPVVLIGGGVGIAPIYPQAKELKAVGNHVIVILGSRSKDLLFWEEKFQDLADEIIITTDDGSKGRKGFVTDALKEIMQTKTIDRVIAIGPLIMMKFVAQLTNGEGTDLPNVPTTVSLNSLMVDGTGMCGSCRYVTNSGETFYACVDGPDVDGHDVNFNNLLQRNARFQCQEGECLDEYEHACLLDEQIDNMKKEGQ
jgi:ferredoxin--NADP+ reductase